MVYIFHRRYMFYWSTSIPYILNILFIHQGTYAFTYSKELFKFFKTFQNWNILKTFPVDLYDVFLVWLPWPSVPSLPHICEVTPPPLWLPPGHTLFTPLYSSHVLECSLWICCRLLVRVSTPLYHLRLWCGPCKDHLHSMWRWLHCWQWQ